MFNCCHLISFCPSSFPSQITRVPLHAALPNPCSLQQGVLAEPLWSVLQPCFSIPAACDISFQTCIAVSADPLHGTCLQKSQGGEHTTFPTCHSWTPATISFSTGIFHLALNSSTTPGWARPGRNWDRAWVTPVRPHECCIYMVRARAHTHTQFLIMIIFWDNWSTPLGQKKGPCASKWKIPREITERGMVINHIGRFRTYFQTGFLSCLRSRQHLQVHIGTVQRPSDTCVQAALACALVAAPSRDRNAAPPHRAAARSLSALQSAAG